MQKITNKYKLPGFSLPALELEHHLNDLREIKSFFEDRNISTKSTRISRYIKYLEEKTSNGCKTNEDLFKNTKANFLDNDLTWHLYVLREVHELMFILKGLKVHVPKGVDEKLSKITAGSDFAASDKNTEHRNTQFELRIASYFCQAGYSVDLSTDTDIIAENEERIYYIECKRIASHRAIKANLEKAKSQISLRMPNYTIEKKAFGIIAADVTKIAYNHNGLTFGITPEHSRDVVREGLYKVLETVRKVDIFTPDLPLIGCWLQIHIPALIEKPFSITTRFSSLLKGYPIDEAACDEVNNIIASGSKDDERCAPPEPLKIRDRVDVPAGTLFRISDDLVFFFMSGQPPENLNFDDYSIVSTLIMNEEKHDFLFFDYKRICNNYTAYERKNMFKDMEHARVGVILEMYAERFRYL